MPALCRAQGWPSEGYRLPDHPVQRAMLAVHAEAAEVDEQEIPAGVDGCGVVTFALPLERMAHAFARFEQLEGAVRVADGMREYPELIRGPLATDAASGRRRLRSFDSSSSIWTISLLSPLRTVAVN